MASVAAVFDLVSQKFVGEERLRDEPLRTFAWEAKLSGVDCSYASVLSMTHSLGWDSLEKLRNLDYGDESKFGIHTVHKDLIVLNIL